MADLWERAHDPETGKPESKEAWAAFCLYRDLGPDERGVHEVSRRLSKSASLIKRWSARWSWLARADAYDDYRDAERRRGAEAEIRKMVVRQARELEAMQRVAFEPTRVMLEKIAAGRLDLEALDAGELGRLARLMAYGYVSAMRGERIARGLSERGPIEVDVKDESSDGLAAAIDRLAEALGVPAGDVVDEIAARRAQKRASGE